VCKLRLNRKFIIELSDTHRLLGAWLVKRVEKKVRKHSVLKLRVFAGDLIVIACRNHQTTLAKYQSSKLDRRVATALGANAGESRAFERPTTCPPAETSIYKQEN
jgi:hypothetical protein